MSFLLELAAKTGLTVHMAVLVGSEAVLIERIDSHGLVKLDTWVGMRMHVHCSAVGKVLIAFLPDEEFRRIVQPKRLIKHNQNTISSMPKLREELARVRHAGFAIDDEEEEIGVRCAGAPVFDRSHAVVAAVSVAGTVTQIPANQVEELGKLVRGAALKISWRLGYGQLPEKNSS